MTPPPTAPPVVPARSSAAPDSADSWRGVAAEDTEVSTTVGIKLQARSRRLLASLVRPHRGLAVFAGFVVVFSELCNLIGPLAVAYAIDTGGTALAGGDAVPLVGATVVYLVAGVGNALFKALFIRLSARVAQAVLLDLRGRVFTQSQALSLSFHERYTSGKVISRMTSDLDALGDLADEGLEVLISGLLSVLAISVTLLVLDLRLGALALAAFVPILLATGWFQRRSRAIYRRTRSAIAAVIVQFTETMNGLRAVLSFRREGRNAAIFSTLNETNARANGDGMVALAIYTPQVRLYGNLSLVATMLAGAALVIDGALEIGVLAAFLLYVRRLYDPLDELAMFYNTYQAAAAALEKLSGLLEEPPSVPEPDHPAPFGPPDGPPLAGDVRFENVSFSYTPEVPVVPRLDLHVPAGQTVALVGATGAGKSTVAKLLARFYDPTVGRVLVDGIDVSAVASDSLRRGVVMVTQESFLFSGSIADNIALGRPSATRAEIEEAADAIGAGDFIRALPERFDTDVRKRGGRLSAGQRQLVGFARAFLADPAVLILDEATALLDIPAERAVQRALHSVLHGRTALIIAHRLSTVQIADRVLVIDRGRVVEDGSLAALASGGSEYAALHAAWRESLA